MVRPRRQGLPEPALKAHCLNKHQITPKKKMRGEAKYGQYQGSIYFRGSVQNRSANYADHRLHRRGQGKGFEPDERLVVAGKWIEPNAWDHFSVPEGELKYRSPAVVKSGEFEWYLTEDKGLQIKL